MLDWFRSWHGAPTDPKWLVIAKRAGVTPIFVSAVAWALFDHASQTEDRGSVAGFDFESYAVLMGAEEEQVRAVYAAMEARSIIVAGRLAQWEKRQPKREDSSAGRMQRKRAAEQQPTLALDAEQVKEEEPPPQPAQAASSPPGVVSPEAVALSDEIAVAAGHDLEFVPPAWCGAAMRVQTWLNAGWSPQVIIQSVKAQMHRKRDGPPDRVQYFEKGIARTLAEQAQPLPTVIPFPAETTQARANGKPQSAITAAADRLIAELESRGSEVRQGASRLLSDG